MKASITARRLPGSACFRFVGMLAVALASTTAFTGASSDAGAALAGPVRQCDRVASPNGHDGGPGTLRAPFKTAQRLVASLAPGQTGCLRRGVYGTDAPYVLDLRRGGRSGEPIRVRSFPGERARLLGIVRIDKSADYVVLSRLTFEGTGGMNTIKIYAAGVVVERSDITNRWRGDSCMILGSNDGAGGAVGTVVRGNRFHECGAPEHDNKDHSIYAANLSDGRIVNNVFWNHTSRAIQLYPDADRNLVSRNIIDGGPPSRRGGIVIGSDDEHTSSENVIERNVIAYAVTWNVYTNWNGEKGRDNVVRLNCLWAGAEGDIETDDGGFAAHDNMIVNPRFRNRARRDYRLLPGSPCRRVFR
jgi:hypothetical protein